VSRLSRVFILNQDLDPGYRFHAESFSEVPEEHHSPHSAWETPDPGYWTRHNYAVVRADEVGLGQSPGVLNTMSRDTSLCFADVIEWAASQSWSTGKVGLLGISYYAGSQWRVAARQPKGLACMIPWEGMSDYYRDRCRHGGILSNTFIDFWWNRQVSTGSSIKSRQMQSLVLILITKRRIGHRQSVWQRRTEMGPGHSRRHIIRRTTTCQLPRSKRGQCQKPISRRRLLRYQGLQHARHQSTPSLRW